LGAPLLFASSAENVEPGDQIPRDLVAIGLVTLVESSGGTGLHAAIPLRREYSSNVAKSFAEVVAREVHRLNPATTTLQRAPAKRTFGSVYLVYVQVGRGKTVVPPYVVRARDGAPVSMVGRRGAAPDALLDGGGWREVQSETQGRLHPAGRARPQDAVAASAVCLGGAAPGRRRGGRCRRGRAQQPKASCDVSWSRRWS